MSGAGGAREPDAARADRLAIIGTGRAGLAIAAAAARGGMSVVALHGRTVAPEAATLPAITAGALPDAIRGATIVLVAVRDAQLDDALRPLAIDGMIASDAAVLHASGATTPTALETLRARGIACGTFHPLVPLLGAGSAPRLHDAYVGVDGDEPARVAARRLAHAVGARPLDIPAGAKPRYHAAAVLASNFPVVLAGLAARLLRDAGVDPAAADGAVRALLRGAVENVESAASLAPADVAAALTGPAARGDVATIGAHLAAIADDATLTRAYSALTSAAVETLRAGGREVPRLGEVERLVAERG